jgi:hypothetical protein
MGELRNGRARSEVVLNETTVRSQHNQEVRMMVNQKVFAALCKYCNETGATKNATSRIALTNFLRDKGYLQTDSQD